MRKIPVVENILDKNEQIAAELTALFQSRGVFVLNLMGSPGAGKTSLLEKTIKALKNKLKIAVIEGDLFTSKDADRIMSCGVPVVQINTSGGCHLDANMIKEALTKLAWENIDLLIVENVGNLVCPAEFKVGESKRATVLSITEGEDKPLKYPLMFKESDVVIIHKADLLSYTDFNMEDALLDIRALNPKVKIVTGSSRTGEGLDEWYSWLCEEAQALKAVEVTKGG